MDYTFANFENYNDKWTKTSGGGTLTFYALGGAYGTVMRLTTPAGGDAEIHRDFTPSYGSNLYKGFTYLELDIDVHGATLIGGDASAIGFDQAGWKYVSLSSYITQGYDGMQHVQIPIADLVSAGLNVDAVSGFMVIRFWHGSVITIDIDNITLTQQSEPFNFEQPALPRKVLTHRWNIQAVDTMKWSKDTLRSQKTQEQIDDLIALDAQLGVTHIAIDVPYDEAGDYTPTVTAGYKAKWISSVRDAGLKVWHRQHFNEWEGDYDFTKTTPRTTPSRALGSSITDVLNGTDTTSWLALHYNYIIDHPTEFASGDIFTPICEIENGGYANGTNDQFSSSTELLLFMRRLQTLCIEAFTEIGLQNQVYVGFWGTSGWFSMNRLDEFTVSCVKYLATDHYIFDPAQMSTDFDTLISYYRDIPLILSEWGNYTEEDVDSSTLKEIFNVLKKKDTHIVGVNYWNDIGGSYESLLESDYAKKVSWYALEKIYKGDIGTRHPIIMYKPKIHTL